MRKTLTYLLVIFLTLFTVGSVYGANKNEALFNKLAKTYILNADGSTELRVSKQLTLYTHTAMNGTYGETFIVYNPEYQKLVVHESYTKQKDGTIIKTPENAFVEVLPRGAAKASEYNVLKEMVVVHTGLELGATIYLDYSIISTPGSYPYLDIFEPLRESSPVANYFIKVQVPANSPISYKIINSNYKAKVSVANGVKNIEWNIKNCPASEREMGVTIEGGNIEMIAINSYQNRDEAFSLLTSHITPLSEANYMKIAASMDKGGDRVAAVSKYIKDNFDRIPLSLKDAGFSIRPLDRVFQSAYGTEVELIALTNYLLTKEGIKNDIVASIPTKCFAEGALSLSAINDLFIVEPGNEVEKSNSELFDYFALTNGAERVKITSKKNKIKESKEIKLTKCDIEKGQNGYLLVDILASSKSSIARIQYLNSKRSTNYLLTSSVDEEYEFKIEIPQGMKLLSKVGEKEIKNKAGEVEISIESDGGFVVVKKKIEIDNPLITPALYKDFRTLVSEWGTDGYNQIIFGN